MSPRRGDAGRDDRRHATGLPEEGALVDGLPVDSPLEGDTFADRAEAGRRLAVALAAYRGRHPLVLAIPRGGVPLGRAVADALGAELDVILVRKLGAPDNPELAVGAVDEAGRVHLAAHAERAGADAAWLRAQAARELGVIRARRRAWGPARDAAGRCLIVVDDGLATGLTMQAALAAARRMHPRELVCAVPVAAPDALRAVRDLADRVVCLQVPRRFYAVGQFYADFRPVEDAEVARLLARRTLPPGAAPVLQGAVTLTAAGATLRGDLVVPAGARGLVLFAHGSGSSRRSPRNRVVAETLQRAGFATLLLDLLTPAEDAEPARRFDIDLLAARLAGAMDWVAAQATLQALPLGLFGASTGAAAALLAAARRPHAVAAVVSRGGRPDLAGAAALAQVRAPTRLIVGGADTEVLALNRAALAALAGDADVRVVPGAAHLFEEPGALERVADLATQWFTRHLATALPRPD